MLILVMPDYIFSSILNFLSHSQGRTLAHWNHDGIPKKPKSLAILFLLANIQLALGTVVEKSLFGAVESFAKKLIGSGESHASTKSPFSVFSHNTSKKKPSSMFSHHTSKEKPKQKDPPPAAGDSQPPKDQDEPKKESSAKAGHQDTPKDHRGSTPAHGTNTLPNHGKSHFQLDNHDSASLDGHTNGENGPVSGHDASHQLHGAHSDNNDKGSPNHNKQNEPITPPETPDSHVPTTEKAHRRASNGNETPHRHDAPNGPEAANKHTTTDGQKYDAGDPHADPAKPDPKVKPKLPKLDTSPETLANGKETPKDTPDAKPEKRAKRDPKAGGKPEDSGRGGGTQGH